MAKKPAVKKPLSKKRTYKKKPTVSMATKMYVKKAISKEIENKSWIDYAINQSISSVQGQTPNYIVLVPRLAQGVQKSQRVGNEIRIKKAYIKGYVNLLPYSATLNPRVAPVIVRLWVCSSKLVNTILLANTNIATTFFDAVNASVGFQGNMLDMLFTPNYEAWKVHATKSFELGLTTTTTGSADNSSFTRKFAFDVTKHLGIIKFDDATTTPTNRNLFLVFQAVYPDGTADAVQVAEFHYQYRIDYEDA